MRTDPGHSTCSKAAINEMSHDMNVILSVVRVLEIPFCFLDCDT